MTLAEVALAVFTACNSVRVFAYLPQIVRIGQDQQGAQAISYSTWSLFAVSHLSTVFYALAVAQDGYMALVFGANTACCATILALTVCKRVKFRMLKGADNPAQDPVTAHDPEPEDENVIWLRRREPQARRFAMR
ncbi:MAG TPA: hypothetical protein VHG30_06375 [Microvirga sp.]|nr:hypothetical protein [Microvirga sp.]